MLHHLIKKNLDLLANRNSHCGIFRANSDLSAKIKRRAMRL